MKHFGIYETVEDAQDALNAGTLENDYVALVDGDLDYNSLAPEEPCYLGEWSDNGAGHYTFQILDTEATAWSYGFQIGTLMGVYFNGGEADMPVKMAFDGSYWSVEYLEPNESASPSHQFEAGSSENWYCDEVTPDPNSSTANILVSYDGADTFVFSEGATGEAVITMYTINPECSEDEPL